MNAEDELLEIAITAANAAGELLLERRRSALTGIDTKSTPTDVVTDADRESDELIGSRIAAARPGDGIVTEEGEGRASASGLVWVVDPLDGTVNYLFDLPLWAVSIAVQDENGLLVGVVLDPNRKETFAAIRGRGATLNGDPISVSDKGELSTALIGTGFSYEGETRRTQAERLLRVLPRVRDIRRGGSVAIDLSWLACGRLDGFFEAPMKPWDRAAGELIVAEAGGVVTPLAPELDDDHGLIAAGSSLHGALTALVVE